MKKWLAGKRFELSEDVTTKAEAYFEKLSKSYFLTAWKI